MKIYSYERCGSFRSHDVFFPFSSVRLCVFFFGIPSFLSHNGRDMTPAVVLLQVVRGKFETRNEPYPRFRDNERINPTRWVAISSNVLLTNLSPPLSLIALTSLQCNATCVSDYWFYPVLPGRHKVHPSLQYNYGEGRWYGWVRKRIKLSAFWRLRQLSSATLSIKQTYTTRHDKTRQAVHNIASAT